VGLDDRDALRMLATRSILRLGSDELIAGSTPAGRHRHLGRDLFPPDMGAQRAEFAKAMTWLFSELIAQAGQGASWRSSLSWPRHRKIGVTQRHYDSMQDAVDDAAQSSDREMGRQARRAARDAVALSRGDAWRR